MTKASFMSGKLCILSCHSFHREIAAAIAAEGWSDVTAAAFPVRCGRPPVSWDDLRPLLDKDCTQVVVLGRACLGGLGEPPPAWPSVRLLHQEQCFHLVAGAALVADAIERGAYLITPAWLEDWPGRLAEMGFTPENSREFFQDFARELMLLDTGIDPQAPAHLAALAEAVSLPAIRIPVGIDHTRLLLAKIVMEWRLKEEQRARLVHDAQRARESADHAITIDCLSRLTQIMTEEEVIDSIEDLFRMLFAPEDLYYLRVENGASVPKHTIPSALLKQMQKLDTDYAWMPECRGFLLRIVRGGQTLGLIAVERLAFPEFRENYLNLALTIAGVCGLAIENARTYQRIKVVDDALHESEQRLALAALHNGVGIWDWNLQSQEMIWDDSMYALYHINREDFSGTEEAWRKALHPDDLERGDREVEAALSGEKHFDTEFRVRWPNGDIRYIKAVAKVFRDDQGKPLRMLGINTDITEHKQAETRLQLAAKVFTHAREGILITDADATIIEVNDAFTRITGYSREEALGQNPRMLQSDRQSQEYYATMWQALTGQGHWYGEIWNRCKNGEAYAELLTISAVRDVAGKTQNYVALFTDITQMKVYQQQLEHIAHYDVLTGLPNRVLLADRLQQAIIQSQRHGRSLAVVFLDLDGFKAVNDRHSHAVGDHLLLTVGNRMKTALREGDTLARIGGDEFVAVLVDLEQPQDYELVLARLLQAAADPVMVDESMLHVSASIGVTVYPQDGADADQLMRHADQAMYQAKKAGKNRYHLFDADQDA
jgi:diguanylate cyclase (GGDEF)-like protein/PAS domain S-box-containing protein